MRQRCEPLALRARPEGADGPKLLFKAGMLNDRCQPTTARRNLGARGEILFYFLIKPAIGSIKVA